jgi:NO-binding membrane sensor protein with MHYT domain
MRTLKTTLIVAIALCIGGAGTYVALPLLKSLRMIPDRQRILARLHSLSSLLTENIGLTFAFD